MTATVIRADARCLPLPDESADLIVTSPPYFGLRSYTDGGEHYDGQIGSEATPREWLAALLDCTREWMRVLKPGGSIFVNLGDKYNSAASNQQSGAALLAARGTRWAEGQERATGGRSRALPDMQPKSLLGLPWRYALGCVDDLGLILRAEIIWAKPNGLPESVTDRVRRSHEQLFHFTRQPRYFSAVDEVREPHAGASFARVGANHNPPLADHYGLGSKREWKPDLNPLGKLPGSVWEIPSQPLTVPAHLGIDHFAAFPMELPRRVILGWSPPGICTACGEGRRPVVYKRYVKGQSGTSGFKKDGKEPIGRLNGTSMGGKPAMDVQATITGYACACPDATAPTRPAIVVDPFGGTGTTALVASMLGRHGITIDLSADYCRLARWRTTDPAERARALGVPKPPPVLDGQESLFEDVAQ